MMINNKLLVEVVRLCLSYQYRLVYQNYLSISTLNRSSRVFDLLSNLKVNSVFKSFSSYITSELLVTKLYYFMILIKVLKDLHFIFILPVYSFIINLSWSFIKNLYFPNNKNHLNHFLNSKD